MFVQLSHGVKRSSRSSCVRQRETCDYVTAVKQRFFYFHDVFAYNTVGTRAFRRPHFSRGRRKSRFVVCLPSVDHQHNMRREGFLQITPCPATEQYHIAFVEAFLVFPDARWSSPTPRSTRTVNVHRRGQIEYNNM